MVRTITVGQIILQDRVDQIILQLILAIARTCHQIPDRDARKPLIGLLAALEIILRWIVPRVAGTHYVLLVDLTTMAVRMTSI